MCLLSQMRHAVLNTQVQAACEDGAASGKGGAPEHQWSSGILVVEYIDAIDVNRARFPADARRCGRAPVMLQFLVWCACSTKNSLLAELGQAE